MKTILKNLFLILSLVFLVSCSGATGGTETGNTAAISLRVIGYQSSTLASALTIGDLEVDTAMVVLDRLRFRPFSACQSDGPDEGADEIRFDGPFIVDLLNPDTISGLEEVEIPSGRYCRIEMVLKKLESPGPLFNRSVLIEGSRGDGTPFEMTTEVDEEFKLENEVTGFLIEEVNPLNIFFIAFDLDQWFDGVDLSDPSIEVSSSSSGPIIRINDVQNQDVQEIIEENLKTSADLFADTDDDEELDLEEQEEPLAEGESIL